MKSRWKKGSPADRAFQEGFGYACGFYDRDHMESRFKKGSPADECFQEGFRNGLDFFEDLQQVIEDLISRIKQEGKRDLKNLEAIKKAHDFIAKAKGLCDV